jgi:MFS family permease
LNTAFAVFKSPNFRAAAFGYFGHMWELYTFWAFLPVMLATYNLRYPQTDLNTPLLSFLIIASGGPACVFSGILSQYFGAKKIAALALFLSCLCCLVSPLFLFSNSAWLLIIFLFIWGIVVIADSPLFSTLVAQNADEKIRGTSLTIVNCIGFAITILSIQFINAISDKINPQYIYILLAIGPIFGLIALLRNKIT